MTILGFSHLSQSLAIEAAAGGEPETLIVARRSRTSALAVMKLIQVDGQALLRPKAPLIHGSAPYLD
jgi:hypothetical protein